jgi:hypothetical protein
MDIAKLNLWAMLVEYFPQKIRLVQGWRVLFSLVECIIMLDKLIKRGSL